MKEETIYRFIVDTEQYSGNFERQMVAYMTGVTADCEVGAEEAKVFAEEELEQGKRPYDKYEEAILFSPDDNGHYRPVYIWPNDAYFNDGKGNYFKIEEKQEDQKTYPAYMSVGFSMEEEPTDEDIDLFTRRAKAFPEYVKNHPERHIKELTITGLKLIEEKVVTTSEIIWWA